MMSIGWKGRGRRRRKWRSDTPSLSYPGFDSSSHWLLHLHPLMVLAFRICNNWSMGICCECFDHPRRGVVRLVCRS